jgi:hypothetical protein
MLSRPPVALPQPEPTIPMKPQHPKMTPSMANNLVLACAYVALLIGYAFLFTTYRSGPEKSDPATVHQEISGAESEDDVLSQH